MRVHCDFPGGNIIVNRTENNTVYLEQDLRSSPWWFYWCFCVEDAADTELTFVFENKEVVGAFGPAVSDNGIDWTWCPQECIVLHTCFRYSFESGENKKYFCFTLGYTSASFERFYREISADNQVVRSVLGTSEQGRDIPLITIGKGEKNILFTCRHHCCESTASYVLEGVIKELLTSRRELLSKYRFHIVPFVDIDGVENGDQGKDRAPHDHNRDYTDEPLYLYTSSMYSYVRSMSIEAFVDFHSPYKWGGGNDMPHLHFGPELPGSKQEDFSHLLMSITNRCADNQTITYDENAVPPSRYGLSGCNKVTSANSKNYFSLKKGVKTAFTLETPYAGCLESAYTPSSLREFGTNVLTALFAALDN